MHDGLSWEAIAVIAGVLVTIFGYFIRIDHRIGKLLRMFDANAVEHRKFRAKMRKQGQTIDNHETRIVKLEERVE